LEEAVYLGYNDNITPEIFRKVTNFKQKRTITKERTKNLASLMENNEFILDMVEIAVEY
jgi:hypothetical protein